MIEKVIAILDKYNIAHSLIFDRYNEPHRHYHNFDHITHLLNEAEKLNVLDDDLFLAILFHDLVYDPRRNDNEEQSAEICWNCLKNVKVYQAVLDTQHHIPSHKMSKTLCKLDMSVLYTDFDTFMDNGAKIAKEYQHLDWKVYQKGRIEFLEKYVVSPIYVSVVKRQKPNIAVYPGSFNPFHVAHLSILEKAEQIFDKVIIDQGINPDKSGKQYELPKLIQNRQIERYDGLLTDFISSLSYDVTIIRGLRNSTDLQYEMNQYRFLQELDPKIKVISIFCDKEHEHISSSSIRTLEKFNKHHNYLVK